VASFLRSIRDRDGAVDNAIPVGEKRCSEDLLAATSWPVMSQCLSHGFATRMSLYYKFVAVCREGRIPQPLAQHSFPSKALVGEHRALSCRYSYDLDSPL